MNIKLVLSTGKEIELTVDEFGELKSGLSEQVVITNYPDQFPDWYPQVTYGGTPSPNLEQPATIVWMTSS